MDAVGAYLGMAQNLLLPINRYLMFLVFVVGGLASTGRSEAARIPDVHGTSLSNEAVNLPEALRGKVGVLIIGFSRGSRDGVSNWGRRLATDYRDADTVVYYEMPVLASAPGMVRGFILRSMKSSVPEQVQPRFVPIMSDEAAWKTLAHYGKADDPYVFVVDGQGEILWQTEGQPTDSAYVELKQQVEALKRKSAK
jgi:ATP10 protein